MASLPEDDGPTMVGASGEHRVATRVPTGHDGDVPANASMEDTTSAQLGAPVARPASAAEIPVEEPASDEADEPDEHTVQQVMPPEVALAAAAAAKAKARARNPAVVVPVPVPTKASKQAVPLVASPSPPPSPARDAAKTDATDLVEEDDPLEDSITATAPRLNAASLMDAAQSGRGVPISIPGRVDIRNLEEGQDSIDDTEVRTRPGHRGLEVPSTLRGAAALPAPRPAAGRPPEIEPEPVPDEGPDDDGVTTQAVAPRVGSVPDIGASLVKGAAEPATRPGVVEESDELLTRPGLGGDAEPPTRPGLEGANGPATSPGLADAPTANVQGNIDTDGYANDEDEDESVTTRAPAAEPYGEDSVTTQAPNVPLELIQAAIDAAAARSDAELDDTSAATTQKVKAPRGADEPLPADGEAESITSQAPGLTNMLRVIASGSSPDIGKGKLAPIEDEDDLPENRTAIMAGAPQKGSAPQAAASASRLPAIRPTGGPLSHGPQGSAAPRLEPSSESGLRVARASSAGDERASLGQLMSAGDARNSMSLPASAGLASEGAGSDSRPHGSSDMGLFHMQPSLHDVDLGKGPSYGLLVAIVGVVSLVVPVILFVVLRRGAEPVTPGVPSEPASEIQKHDGPRTKALRGKNGLTIVPSAAVSASSAKPNQKGPPFGRR